MRPIRQEGMRLFMEASRVFARMEHNGARIDVSYLDQKIKETGEEIRRLDAEIRKDPLFSHWRKELGAKANPGSPEQMARVVFGRLGYKSPGKTATGRDKASRAALEGIDLPIVKNYLRMKRLEKTRSTFLGGIRDNACGDYLHPSFNLHTAESMRSSSSQPNSQNLPSRDKEMTELTRTAFLARPGRRLVEMDFASQEVRVGCSMHRDPAMVRYLTDPTSDMHRDAALMCFKLAPEELGKTDKGHPGKDVRYSAKNKFVFAQFYGSYYLDCAKNLWNDIDVMGLRTADGSPMRDHLAKKGVTKLGACDENKRPVPGTYEHLVKQAEEGLWKTMFPVYDAWRNDHWNKYLKEGGFDLPTGFRIEGVYKRNQVFCDPVQGSAFHCLLWVLIELQKLLDKYKMKSLLTLQIHDCLVADVPEEELQDFIWMAYRLMHEKILKAWTWLIVPLDAEVEVTPLDGRWHDKKQWVEKNREWGPK